MAFIQHYFKPKYQYPTLTFCFSVDTVSADVTIQANTWVPCSQWKSSGASDPLVELHSESDRKLLAENDDGNSISTMNCFGSVLSYRLPRGDYRAVIRNVHTVSLNYVF